MRPAWPRRDFLPPVGVHTRAALQREAWKTVKTVKAVVNTDWETNENRETVPSV